MDSLDFTLLKSQINNLLDDYSNIPGSQEQVGDVTEEAPAKDLKYVTLYSKNMSFLIVDAENVISVTVNMKND